MCRTHLLLLACCALPATAAGQSIAIFPSTHANLEGYSSTVARNSGYPLSAGVNRTQFLYESWDVTVPHNTLIRKVGFRQDGSSALPPNFRIQVEVRMGLSEKDVATASRYFAQNYSGAVSTVYDKKLFDLPQADKPATPPATTYVLIPLDRPFTHDTSKNLLVDYLVYANSVGNQTFAYPLDWAQYETKVDKIGTGCMSTANTVPVLNTQPTYLGGSWSHGLTKCPINTLAIFSIGYSRTHAFGIPLPIDLGGTGCKIWTSLNLLVTRGVNSSGWASLALPVPNDRALDKQPLFAQALVIDPFANPIGLVTSNSTETTFGLQPRVAKIYSRGSTTKTSGSVDKSDRYGQIVSVFEHD